MSENNYRHIGSFLKKKNKGNQNGGKNYLFAIAIDDYTHCPKLYNPVKDAQELIAVLKERYNFEDKNIQFLFNQKATEENIDKGFLKLAETITSEDNLIIFFSGHGEYDQLRDRGFWVPVNAEQGAYHNYISNSDIRDNLNAIKARHTFLIADSCFSGSLFATYKSTSGLNRLEKDPSRWGLTAGRNELVLDGKPGTNSPFADSLIYQLRRTTRPVGVSELCNKVIETVISNAEQTPRGEPLKVKGHMGGQFFFHPVDVDLDVIEEQPAEISEKAEKLAKFERQRTHFKTNISTAENHFKEGNFKEAREAYGASMNYFHSTFAPDLSYIEKKIEECSQKVQFGQLIEDGKKAFLENNYSLAIQYFNKAKNIEHTQKVKDWIKSCEQQLKIETHKKVSSLEAQAKADFDKMAKPKQSEGMKMVKWILGGVAVIFIIVLVGLGSIFDSIGEEGWTNTTTQNLLQSESNNQKTSEQKILDNLIGGWMISDVYVNNISMTASGNPPYENWDFFENGTALQRNLQGEFPYNFSLNGNFLIIGLITYKIEFIDSQNMTLTYTDGNSFFNKIILTKV